MGWRQWLQESHSLLCRRPRVTYCLIDLTAALLITKTPTHTHTHAPVSAQHHSWRFCITVAVTASPHHTSSFLTVAPLQCTLPPPQHPPMLPFHCPPVLMTHSTPLPCEHSYNFRPSDPPSPKQYTCPTITSEWLMKDTQSGGTSWDQLQSAQSVCWTVSKGF